MAETILVFGATGKQGGSVVKNLLQDKEKFRIRAVTRNPDSDKGKALAALGVEVVKADLNNKESVRRAVQGAQGVYLVTDTDYTVPDIYAAEYKQIKDAADACKKAGVGKVVFSTQPIQNRTDILPAPEIDSKTDGFTYIQSIGVPVAGVSLMVYMENMSQAYFTKKERDGVYSFRK